MTIPHDDSPPAARTSTVVDSVRTRLFETARRFAPTERQRLFALTVIIGAACGLAAVAFHLAIDLASHLFIERASSLRGYGWVVGVLLVPTLGAVAAGLLLQYVVPNARGSGVPQVKVAYMQEGGRVRFRDAVGKFFISALQLGTGSSLGREGPTVQICSGVASFFGRAARISQPNLRRLLPVGAAAGIAAAFNAPIAAVTFTIEEIVGTLDQTVLSGVIVAAALAAVVERSVLGVEPVFTIRQPHHLEGPGSLLVYVALGVAAAGLSIAFTDGLLGLRRKAREWRQLPAWAVPGVGGLVTGTLGVLAFATLHTGGITGGGYVTLANGLAGSVSVKAMLALCIMKAIATVFSYSTGGAGGIFAPSLFIGGMLGGVFGSLDSVLFHHPASSVGSFALVGMGAVFAGIVRAPMTSVLIIIEMTGGYSLILPLMIANMSAYALARHFRPTPIYDALLEQDGIHLKPRSVKPASEASPFPKVPVDASPFHAFGSRSPARELVEIGGEPDRQAIYPVIDEGRLVGVVTPADIAFVAADRALFDLVYAADLMRPAVWVTPDDDVRTAFEKMRANGLHALPITDASGNVIALVDEVALAHELIHARGATGGA